MRLARLIGLVLVLTVGPVGEAAAQQNWTKRSVGAARGDRIDLGTATPGHLEAAVGPFALSMGAFNRLQVGTYVVPWFTWVVAPGSVVANGFAKARLFRVSPFSFAVHTAVFRARLDDLDGDELNVRAWIWPSKLIVGTDWTPRLSSTVELTGVLTDITAKTLVDTDAEVEGVALARTLHLGMIPRFEIARWLTLFLRGRLLLGHAPVVATATSELSDTTRVKIEARAEAAQLTSGLAAVGGFHLHWPWISLSVAGGRGTWFLPWIQLPVGQTTWIGEFDLTFRF